MSPTTQGWVCGGDAAGINSRWRYRPAVDVRPRPIGNEDPADRGHPTVGDHLACRVVVHRGDAVGVARPKPRAVRPNELRPRNLDHGTVRRELGVRAPHLVSRRDVEHRDGHSIAVEMRTNPENPTGDGWRHLHAAHRPTRADVVRRHAHDGCHMSEERDDVQGSAPRSLGRVRERRFEPDAVQVLAGRVVQHRGHEQGVPGLEPVAHLTGQIDGGRLLSRPDEMQHDRTEELTSLGSHGPTHIPLYWHHWC